MKTLICGVKTIVCTCGKTMERVGGEFGGNLYASADTYYCSECQKHVIVVTPKSEEQESFKDELGKLAKAR